MVSMQHDEHVDVLIIGAGLSGIGAAHQVQAAFPDRSYLVLEARDSIGGTWDLFRYPGVRSDSDMHTLGYRFKPWTHPKAIADGASILSYIRATAAEAGIEEHIRLGHRAVAAAWSTADARWTVSAVRADGTEATFTCRFLYANTGYYRYDAGYTPDFPGRDAFHGPVIHPQHWPEELDYTGKHVVVIGSGATAITLLPAMADRAAHVTMLQRTPSYILPLPERDKVANGLRRIVGDDAAYVITRWKNVLRQVAVYQGSRRFPTAARRLIRRYTAGQLPDGVDVDTHFNPPYAPWDQRLCIVPDHDLFKALRSGAASVVTGRIETFNATGIRLESGEQLDADLIVTATGLDVLAFGGLRFTVDGADRPVSEAVAYKGMMLSDIPNFAFTVGYTNSSWTLKADLVAEYVVRLLAHMDATGLDIAFPHQSDPDMPTRPLLDFGAGYVQRALDRLPKAGAAKPWTLGMHYPADLVALRHAPLEDDVMTFRSSESLVVVGRPRRDDPSPASRSKRAS